MTTPKNRHPLSQLFLDAADNIESGEGSSFACIEIGFMDVDKRLKHKAREVIRARIHPFITFDEWYANRTGDLRFSNENRENRARWLRDLAEEFING